MNRRSYLESAGVAATAGLLAGCSSPGNSEASTTYGTLAASVSDQPADIEDFESCVVTIAGIWVAPADEDGSATEATASTGTEDRRYIEFEESQIEDLVELQGDASQSLGEWDLEVGTYQYLQLDVSGVDGTLDDGSEADVRTPGNAPLRFNTSFEIRENQRTHFLADFTPVRQGNSGRYIIQPVASETTVTYGTATEADETETAAATDTATSADTATDTSTATTTD